MANIAINTAQNVNIDYKIVGIGERMLAFLIDAVILAAYVLLLNYLIGITDKFDLDDWTRIGVYSLLMLPVMTYSLWCHLFFQGRTVGKIALKIRVVREDGTPTAWNHLIVRWMLRLIDIWLMMSIGVVSIIFSDKKQRVGDAAAGTIVISTKNKNKISSTILEDLDEDYTPVFNNVIVLTDKDVRIIKDIYAAVTLKHDFKTLKMLREKVASVIQVESELFDKPFIETVLKDYNYYTQQM